METERPIGFAGLSHLGIVSSIATASKGAQVLAFDPDEDRAAALRDGKLPLVETGLLELLARSRAQIKFTSRGSELQQCKLVYLSNDVPTDQNNRSDLSALECVVEQVLPHLTPETILVVLSQVTPGFTRRLADRALCRKLHVYYQVETLIFGNAVERAIHPERFIVGCREPRAALPTVYRELLERFGCRILPMNYESAELCKIAINVFLVSSVSATNMLAEVCEAIHADWSEIAPALRLDRRIGPHAYLSPGMGISGGNLERDLMTVRQLADENGTDARLVDEWLALSRYRRDWALRIIHSRILPHCPDPVIAIWGLAYKPDTASTKNSPGLSLVEALQPFPLRMYDPVVRLPDEPRQCKTALEACQGADVLVVMTPWREFSGHEPKQLIAAMKGRWLLDPFRVFADKRDGLAGLSYFQLGA
jgi:UDPglucose 6-dehydrogenase